MYKYVLQADRGEATIEATMIKKKCSNHKKLATAVYSCLELTYMFKQLQDLALNLYRYFLKTLERHVDRKPFLSEPDVYISDFSPQ